MAADWCVVIPQKDLVLAKSRMNLEAADRRRLSLAMLGDTIAAVAAASTVMRIFVVCDNERDADVIGHARVTTYVNRRGGGLNAAVEAGVGLARSVHPHCAVAALPADLPALRADELAHALRCALRHARSFVADASGTGTTLLEASSGHQLHPSYGESSRALHALSGATELRGRRLGSLRRDVDDLPALRRTASGCGPLTSRVYAALAAGRTEAAWARHDHDCPAPRPGGRPPGPVARPARSQLLE